MSHADNLIQLADYLDKLPDDYAEFDMADFIDGAPSKKAVKDYALSGAASCGTAACAVGHGPAAGLFVLPSEIDMGAIFSPVRWFEYAHRVFGVSEFSNDFIYMFGGGWAEVDNTPKGAARRIRHYVAHGVPEDFDGDNL